MAEKIYLHIGAPKSGTTFIQTLLWKNQANLSAAGILLPGEKRFDHNHIASLARNESPGDRVLQTWKRIERQIQRWSGTVVISNEWLSMATQEQVERFIDRLQPAEVHVIFTARPLVSAVPAAWQEALKLGFSSSIDEFAAGLELPDKTQRWWWGTMDPAVVLPRWSASLPADRIHVVPMPPRSLGPDVLWERFAETCGIEAGICDSNDATANESVGAESARLLQLLGPELRAAVKAESSHWTVPYKWLRGFLSHALLAPMDGTKIGLSTGQIEALEARSEKMVNALQDSGYRIHGDLSELRNGSLTNSIHPEAVPDSDVLPIALKLIPALLERAYEESRRADKAVKRVAILERDLAKWETGKNISTYPGSAFVNRLDRKLELRTTFNKLRFKLFGN